MSLFGKLLLVVNLLAAGGFVYLATQDWKGRQTINAAGLRHVILLTGLPLDGPTNFSSDDETSFVVEGPGGVPTRTISKKLLESYFQAGASAEAGPNSLGTTGAVPNQLAEVRRVKAKVEELLGKAANDAERIQLLRGWLLYQAETFATRNEVLALTSTERDDPDSGKSRPRTEDELKQAADELQKLLLARIDAVLEAPRAPDAAATTPVADADLAEADTLDKKDALLKERLARVAASRVAPLDENERLMKIAHLLVHLDQSAAWQKRAVLVVGIRRYVQAIEAQVRRFREMSLHLDQLLVTDQEGFLDRLASLAIQAKDATRVAVRQESIRAKWEAQAIKDGDLLAQRETQLTELRNQLTKVKNEVDVMLARQTTIESGLFEIQREVAITLDEVYRLEAVLRARELQLLGTPEKK